MSGIEPLAYTVEQAVKATGLTRTRLYEYASHGCITFRRAGRRTVILADDLKTLLSTLPPAPIKIKTLNVETISSPSEAADLRRPGKRIKL